jgi:hypothetical protein
MRRTVVAVALHCASCAQAAPPPRATLPVVATHGWHRYDIPAHWPTERREAAITRIIGAVGWPLLRKGEVDEVVIDHARGTIHVHGNVTGHEEIVRSLGGCVLYGDDEEGTVVDVVFLSHADASRVVKLAAPRFPELRMVADPTTQGVVLSGRQEIVNAAKSFVQAVDLLSASRSG